MWSYLSLWIGCFSEGWCFGMWFFFLTRYIYVGRLSSSIIFYECVCPLVVDVHPSPFIRPYQTWSVPKTYQLLLILSAAPFIHTSDVCTIFFCITHMYWWLMCREQLLSSRTIPRVLWRSQGSQQWPSKTTLIMFHYQADCIVSYVHAHIFIHHEQIWSSVFARLSTSHLCPSTFSLCIYTVGGPDPYLCGCTGDRIETPQSFNRVFFFLLPSSVRTIKNVPTDADVGRCLVSKHLFLIIKPLLCEHDPHWHDCCWDACDVTTGGISDCRSGIISYCHFWHVFLQQSPLCRQHLSPQVISIQRIITAHICGPIIRS